jgi:hypothetical protein
MDGQSANLGLYPITQLRIQMYSDHLYLAGCLWRRAVERSTE